ETAGWRTFSSSRGAIRVLDARLPAPLALLKSSLASEVPDACVFLETIRETRTDPAEDIDHCAELIALIPSPKPFVIGVLESDSTKKTADELGASLRAKIKIRERFLGVEISDSERFRQVLAERLPEEAQLEIARLAGLRELQK